MIPLNCCKGCDGLNENGVMRNKLRCLVNCDKYYDELEMKLYNEQAPDKGCSTCKNCKHVAYFPGFVTAEECVCDTVSFSVKNCPKWIGRYEEEK